MIDVAAGNDQTVEYGIILKQLDLRRDGISFPFLVPRRHPRIEYCLARPGRVRLLPPRSSLLPPTYAPVYALKKEGL